MMSSRIDRRGFTLIEIIISVVLVGIIMIPVSIMVMEFVRSSVYIETMAVSSNLATREMSIVDTISFDSLTNASYTNYAGYAYDLDRIVDTVNHRIKKILVKIFSLPRMAQQNPFLELNTYALVRGVTFGGGSCGAETLGIEKEYFETAPPTTLQKDLIDGIMYRNTRLNGNLTMVGIKLSCSPNRLLYNFDVDGRARMDRSYNLSSDETYAKLYSPFFIKSNTTYGPGSGRGIFIFQAGSGMAYTLTATYVFYDGSESGPYQYIYTPTP